MCKSNEDHLLPVEIVGKTEVWTEIAQLQDRRQLFPYWDYGRVARDPPTMARAREVRGRLGNLVALIDLPVGAH